MNLSTNSERRKMPLLKKLRKDMKNQLIGVIEDGKRVGLHPVPEVSTRFTDETYAYLSELRKQLEFEARRSKNRYVFITGEAETEYLESIVVLKYRRLSGSE